MRVAGRPREYLRKAPRAASSPALGCASQPICASQPASQTNRQSSSKTIITRLPTFVVPLRCFRSSSCTNVGPTSLANRNSTNNKQTLSIIIMIALRATRVNLGCRQLALPVARGAHQHNMHSLGRLIKRQPYKSIMRLCLHARSHLVAGSGWRAAKLVAKLAALRPD